MPYYCTVPRCTSMAGKAKNVSFHQFPRDEELAKIWNNILKRGKPYTKYSKVCSLHFKPEDYMTVLGKNKAQWKSLRKDAVPSQNLPSDALMTCHRNRNTGTWLMNNLPQDLMDSQEKINQMAHAIYTQTILAIQASGAANLSSASVSSEPDFLLNGDDSTSRSSNSSSHFNESMSHIEQMLNRNNINYGLSSDTPKNFNDRQNANMFFSNSSKDITEVQGFTTTHTFKCTECSKCFKDPDVYLLHKRVHSSKTVVVNEDEINEKYPENMFSEKENFDNNANNSLQENSPEETLRANPILAKLLKSTTPQFNHKADEIHRLDSKNVTSIENQIMMDLDTNMKNYFRNLSRTQKKQMGKVNFQHDDNSSIDLQNANEEAMEDDENIIKQSESELSEVDSNCDSKGSKISMNANSSLIVNDNSNFYGFVD